MNATMEPVQRIRELRDVVLAAHHSPEFSAAVGGHMTWLLGELADGLSDVALALERRTAAPG